MSISRKPNFFILGAPKCATTSLASWLAEHPRIFMSTFKEPHFFNTDDRQGVSTLPDYEKLFRNARKAHIAVGEASVWYLSSADAVRNILAYQPEARFIVMLRNPTEMAAALHAEMVLTGHENVRDFGAAWDLQEDRREGRYLPAFVWARRRLIYGDICKLGAQLERLLSNVDSSRVLTVVLDDLSADPRMQYLRALHFLGLEDDNRSTFPVHNRARVVRWPHVTRLLFIITQLKARLGISFGLGLWNRVAEVNLTEAPRDQPRPETLVALRKYFTEDIELLGRLLGKDFQHWIAGNSAAGKPRGSTSDDDQGDAKMTDRRTHEHFA